MEKFVSLEKLLFTHKPLATQNDCAPADSYQNLIKILSKSYQKGRVKSKNRWYSYTFRLF